MILNLIETGGPGGAEQMLLRLVDAYSERGRAQLVCLRKDGWLAEQFRKRDVSLEIVEQGRLPDFDWLARIKKLIREHGVTAIHSHEFAMNVHAGMLGWTLKLPVAATVHGKNYYGDKLSRRLAYRCASLGATFVAVSDDIRDYLQTKVGLAKRRLRVITNGVDIARFRHDPAARAQMRQRFGVDDDDVLIGAIGSYYPVKGHRHLIDAMPLVCRTFPNARLLVAGQGPLAAELRKQADNLGLAKSVEICGYVEDIPGLLSALDVFVLPSLSEGLPLALLEAAANGRAMVATNVGGIPEVLSTPEVGLLVPPADPQALASALLEVLNDPVRRAALGQRAHSLVASRWSFDATVHAYLELLEQRAA